MTSAPKSDSTVAAAGAAMKLAQSITFSPANRRSVIVVLIHASTAAPSFRGASEASEPGIHNQGREYGFRAWPYGPSRNDG